MTSAILRSMAVSVPQIDAGTQDFLKAIASQTRQQIMLLFIGGIELTVGEVAERAGLGQSTASEHLSLLRRGGLVQCTRDGKTVRYCANAERIRTELERAQSYLTVCLPATDMTTDPSGLEQSAP